MEAFRQQFTHPNYHKLIYLYINLFSAEVISIQISITYITYRRLFTKKHSFLTCLNKKLPINYCNYQRTQLTFLQAQPMISKQTPKISTNLIKFPEAIKGRWFRNHFKLSNTSPYLVETRNWYKTTKQPTYLEYT